ncbi:alpha-L-fucosidase [Niabella aurantiaca]|uniref:alpha-L-fucosidase n=1 Tax=Niabella aurantiaca TaxID=379900 RepID=UPI00036A7226|nr:alpha-L-fucosidase [Niabella aurantiaca]
MKKTILFLAIFLAAAASAQKALLPVPATKPNRYQQQQIERRYGMFLHFGINTFHDEEWTDGSKPAVSYAPTAIDAEQWIRTARDAGMKYVILITKHHDGFCLWDSKATTYDVASSSNRTNVVAAVAKACKKYNIGLGLYYSLWDRKQNPDTKDASLDAAYNAYMLRQLNELMDITRPYTRIVEFWFDGGWMKANNRWPIAQLYQVIKQREPQCQVGINWSIGAPGDPDKHAVLPEDQKTGYPIRYFPGDFRLGDPHLPAANDPKLFAHNGQLYYMPWESTVCISKRWFYNTKDTSFKPVDELEKLYHTATRNSNILILNCPPNRKGKIRQRDIDILTELRKRLKI